MTDIVLVDLIQCAHCKGYCNVESVLGQPDKVIPFSDNMRLSLAVTSRVP